MQTSYEIWMHTGSKKWDVFTDITEEFRTELYRKGWTFVLRNEGAGDEVERDVPVKKQPPKKDK